MTNQTQQLKHEQRKMKPNLLYNIGLNNSITICTPQRRMSEWYRRITTYLQSITKLLLARL